MLLPPAPPDPTEAPSLQNRQIDFRILTQTVVRASTTIVTTITLGTIEPVATETIAVVPLPVTHHHGLSGGQIGAILGSVVGVVVLLLIVGFCYVGRRRMPITYEEETKETKKTKRKRRRSSSRTTRGIYQYTEEDIYYIPTRKKSSSRRASVKVEVQEPAAAVVTERIPGGPKFPTYRAIPISNPRNPQVWRS
ncbi:hypothetical protein TsFJ059_003052 [Trichoderma semiorbis]|uniref:Uncharacterized protein n=1 Tax=Trichoderma semiorbis TaxID=1491008 RepID=A0A9P8HNM6_9HYPO|nr:hypothetical protein TsFJ059_003052 [Trichoderma semiorbis]